MHNISVIMPVYNAERYLEQAICSTLSQEGVLEIIAVDDGSTDQSRALLLSLAEKDPRIKPHLNEKNMGVAAVRNLALSLATGDYLAFVDADDLVPPGAYHALLSAAEGCDVVIGAHSDRYDNGAVDPLCTVAKEHRSSLFLSLFTVSCLWTKLIRRDFVTKNRLAFEEDMTIGEDVVFLAHAVTKQPTYRVIDTLVYYHCQHDCTVSRSLTHIYTLSAFQKHMLCRERLLSICADVPEARDFVFRYFSGFMTEFLLRMPSGEDKQAAFLQFRAHILSYEPFRQKPALFRAMFGMEYEAFSTAGAEEYTEAFLTLKPRQRVLYEYEAGQIGFAWILQYAKAWLKFKCRRHKDQ